MAHQSPILAAASLPKSSSIRSTHSPLCQGWEKAILFNSLEQTQSQKKNAETEEYGPNEVIRENPGEKP